jgi:hypothetical protein
MEPRWINLYLLGWKHTLAEHLEGLKDGRLGIPQGEPVLLESSLKVDDGAREQGRKDAGPRPRRGRPARIGHFFLGPRD